MAEIQIQNITKIYPRTQTPAVDDVSLRVADGEFMVLLGPSGCGKTTLLRMLAGLEYPEAGRIMIGAREVTDLPPRARQIAMVFQSYAVFPHMTVADNIGFGLRMRKEDAATIRRKVERAAEMLELSPYLARFPAQLSGGQRQRVAVARAIVMEPQVLLMDEPLSNLDALLRLQFRAELKRLVAEVGATTIYVTHDQVEALSLGDRIAVMRQGRIVQCAPPMQVYDQPADAFVGGFIGNPPMNFLRARVERHDGQRRLLLGGHPLATEPPPAADGAELTVGIRAESIEASAEPLAGALPATAEVVEPAGSHLLITARVGDQRVKLLTRTDFAVRPDGPIWLRPEPDKLRWFEPASGQTIGAPAR
ncbi:MAG TPA: ABC transporter ATP-binding protein [Chloroflexaceae bacterium]|nr:ABC transporter ATP-binding protein [Chloroflexaceae bacterium]